MAYIYDLSDTWNAAGTTFFGIKMNVTNSASAAASRLLSLQVGSVEQAWVGPTGSAYFAGNVGIGTASPGVYKLNVSGDVYGSSFAIGADANLIYQSASNSLGFRVGTSTNQAYFNVRGVGGIPLLDGAGGVLTLGTAGSERVRIDSSGNVGIGTSSPQSRFHVDAPAGGGSFFTGTGNYNGGYPTAVFGLNIGYNFQAGAADVDFFNSWTGATGSQGGFSFRRQTGASSQTSLMRIDGSGNLLVGSTSSPSGNGTNLQIANSAAARLWLTSTGYRNFYLESSSGNALQFVDATAGAERMRLTSAGNLLVGTTSPLGGNTASEFKQTTAGSWPLTLNANDRGLLIRNSAASSGFYAYFEYNNGTNNGSISWSGGTTAYNTTSDARIKDNIVDAPEAGDLIDGIKVRSWDFKADGAHWRYGMVAQELLEVVPEAVSVPADEDMMMGVDYSKLVPMLVKEIQSLRARVAQLEGN